MFEYIITRRDYGMGFFWHSRYNSLLLKVLFFLSAKSYTLYKYLYHKQYKDDITFVSLTGSSVFIDIFFYLHNKYKTWFKNGIKKTSVYEVLLQSNIRLYNLFSIIHIN